MMADVLMMSTTTGALLRVQVASAISTALVTVTHHDDQPIGGVRARPSSRARAAAGSRAALTAAASAPCSRLPRAEDLATIVTFSAHCWQTTDDRRSS